jgi:hypothetical protein
MTPEQALQILSQALVTKPGLTMQDIATVIQAWNVIAEAVKEKTIPEKK